MSHNDPNSDDEQPEAAGGHRTEAAGMLDDSLDTMTDQQDDSGGYADPADARITRNEHGEKIPQDVTVQGVGLHKVEPMSYGDVQSYMGSGAQHQVEEEALAALFNRFILEPDYAQDADKWASEMGYTPEGKVTAQYIEDMKPLVVREILTALFEASGIDADVIMEGTTANVDVEGGNPSA